MFGMGWPEIFVILLVAMIVFGPERLPDMARQAGRLIRTVKQMADQAKGDLRRELGDEYSDLHLSDLDPRKAVRDIVSDAFKPDDTVPPPIKSARVLRPGEIPPFDDEAT